LVRLDRKPAPVCPQRVLTFIDFAFYFDQKDRERHRVRLMFHLHVRRITMHPANLLDDLPGLSTLEMV